MLWFFFIHLVIGTVDDSSSKMQNHHLPSVSGKVEESVRVISIIEPRDKYNHERERERRSIRDRSPSVECPSKESDKDDTNPGASVLKPRSCPKRTNRR